MSYLCLLASECAMAVVGDSRLTLSPVPLHWDKARKIGCDQGQRCLWACCGLTVFGGVNYVKLAARIFHGSGTLTEKAQALAKRVNPSASSGVCTARPPPSLCWPDSGRSKGQSY